MTKSAYLVLLQNFRTLAQHHELLIRVMHREITSRYRQSFLGIAWAFLKPMATVAIFTFVFSIIAKLPSGQYSYPLFVLSGFLPWTFFSVSVATGISSLTSQTDLITKIYFPREILPLASMAASALDFLITLLFLITLMIYSHVELSWNILFAIPILAIEILWTVGIMLFMSLINVWYRDITHFAVLMLQLWMYLTPVVYPFNMVPESYRILMWLNPMVGIVEGFRSAVIRAESPDAGMLLTSLVISLLVFFVGYGVFKKNEFRLADTI